MLIITEYVDNTNLDLICEKDEDGKDKGFIIKGPFIQTEVKNKNGRIYTKSLMEREVNKFIKTKIEPKRALGELDHPPTPTLNLDRVSHLIESLEFSGNDVIGTARILTDLPKGKIAQGLLKAGVQLGVSTRGVGTLTGNKVNDDFNLITVDLVADPSAPNAFVEGILESKDWILDGNSDIYVEKSIEKMEKTLDKKGSKVVLDVMLEFLNDIRRNIN